MQKQMPRTILCSARGSQRQDGGRVDPATPYVPVPACVTLCVYLGDAGGIWSLPSSPVPPSPRPQLWSPSA